MNSFLETIQRDVARHLNTHEAFKAIPVLSHEPGSYKSVVTELAQTGAGTSIVVLNPIPSSVISTESGLSFEEILFRVRVIECPVKTEDSYPAIVIAEAVMERLDHYSPQVEAWSGWLELAKKQPVREVRDPANMDRTILEITFIAGGSR